MPRVRSLSTRFVLISLAWSAFAVVAMGVLLTSTYRSSVERQFDETLNVYMKALIVEVARQTPGFREITTAVLGEPRFDFPLSGWYWVIRDLNTGAVILVSRSLAGDSLPLDELLSAAEPGDIVRTTETGPGGETIRIIARAVLYDAGARLLFAVAGDTSSVTGEVNAFRGTVLVYLGLFALLLIIATLVQVRVGLRPLERMRLQLRAIQAGRTAHLEGDFPDEIAPLAVELNNLIDSNRAVVKRARHHVGNLAHALKTPLSVVLNEVGQDASPTATAVREQARIMEQQVRHHLERAQIAAKRRLIGAITDVGPAVHRLCRTIERLSQDRGITVAVRDDAGPLQFAGEQNDFEDMLGNLVDNAVKWAESRVVVTVGTRTAADGGERLEVTVDDDGPGLTEAARTAALSRGARLDETKPGTGLGLSIVSELAELYGGRFSLGRAPIGGLRAVLILPLVQLP